MKIFTNKELKLLPINNIIKEIYSKIIEEASLGKAFYICLIDKINQIEIIKGVQSYFPEIEISNEEGKIKFEWFNDDIKKNNQLDYILEKIQSINYII